MFPPSSRRETSAPALPAPGLSDMGLAMHKYYFDLINTDKITDAKGAVLSDDEQAKKVAHNLARDVRADRPELVGRGFEVLIRTESGEEISRVPVDQQANGGE
jgi:hypothetical protein